MAGKQTIAISVLADTSRFTKGMSGASSAAAKFSKAFKVGAAVVGAGVVAIGVGVKKSIDAAKAAQVVYAQTGAVLKSTGSIAGRTAKQLDAQAVSLSKLSGADDVAVRKGQNVLLTFTQIRGVNFDKATASALDMATAMHTDMSSAAMTVGKALNDPIAGVSRLTKVGVTFTDAQKAQVAAMVKTGNVAGAQGVILNEIQKEFGGSAAAYGKTAEGAADRAKAAFGRIQVFVGGKFLPVIGKAFGTIADILDKVGESKKFDSIVTSIAAFITGILSGKSALGSFIAPLARVYATLSPLGIALKGIGPSLPALGEAFGKLGVALGKVVVALLPLATEIAGVLTKALGALAPVLVQVVTVIVNVVSAVIDWVVANKSWISAIGAAVGVVVGIVAAIRLFKAVQLGLAAATYGMQGAYIVAGTAAKVYGAIMNAQAIATKVAAGVQLAFNAVMSANPIMLVVTAIAALVAGLVWFFTQTKIGQQLWSGFIKGVTDAWSAFTGWITQSLGNLGSFFSDAWKNIGGFFSDAWKNIQNIIKTALGVVVNLFLNWTVLGLIIKHWNDIIAFFRGLGGKIKAAFSAAINWLTSAGKNIITGLSHGITGAWNGVKSWIGGIGGRVKGALGNAGSILLQAGRNIISGFLNGLKGGFTKVKDWIGGIGKWIASHKGPKAYDLALLVPNGGWIMSGLQRGLAAGMPGLRSMLGTMTGEVASAFDMAPSATINARHISSDARTPMHETANGPAVVRLDAGTVAALAAAMSTTLRIGDDTVGAATNRSNLLTNLLGGY